MYCCVRGTRTQLLICVGCSVPYWVSIREVFQDCILRRRRHTFASLWGACLRFASLWRANSHGDSCVLGIHLSNVCWGLLFCLRKSFIFLKCIDLCLMHLPKRSSFKSLLKVYTLSKILLWIKPSYFSLENACYSWCMHQTGFFSSACRSATK